MTNVNEAISNNIMRIMKQNNIKQVDLANHLGVSKQIVNNMLNGSRMINAIELKEISKFLGVSMEEIVDVSKTLKEKDVVKDFIGRVESDEAKRGLQIVDEIANLICFYSRTQKNSKEMMEPWEA